MNITFQKASTSYIETIFSWLTEPHMMEFWDNSQEHKDDILNFIHGKPQTYFAGTTQYWIGFIDKQPYAFVLSDILKKDQKDLSSAHLANMSETGHTISLDFGIGNKEYLGRGLAAPTLSEFMIFYKKDIDPKADTFFIDPDENNPRAINVYNKAGFTKVGMYQATQGAFIGQNSDLMVKKIMTITNINHITLAVTDIHRSFEFYKNVLGFKPLVKWDQGAYFLIGDFWFCLNVDLAREPQSCYTHYAFSVNSEDFELMVDKIQNSGAHIFKDNTSPGESLYFLDPDGHKLEIHVGNSEARIAAKKANPGNWKNVEWFV